MNIAPTPTPPKPRRRWLPFSLRTLLAQIRILTDAAVRAASYNATCAVSSFGVPPPRTLRRRGYGLKARREPEERVPAPRRPRVGGSDGGITVHRYRIRDARPIPDVPYQRTA
jgi:hypothetical protein